ncbi:matrixin family metalloprotease [Arsenicibacter rosenii]|uniref:Peptidase metallopeptidase domain-containing protein n=1 Tax=Arsenicibacter rosenii TaxID=1750698 RepID=A0A1S2VFX4_9BACT|nr:matrixin family metalloprotease [Arsenicibacter rosenii]OIN57612.1 hypothetical protein BLX24_19230 [Arsenicibacter rosenii]
MENKLIFEYTKEIAQETKQRAILRSIQERESNLSDLSDQQKGLLNEIKVNPENNILGDKYSLILEMAAQLKKMWRPSRVLKVYFFQGDNIKSRVLEYASIWSEYCSIRFVETMDRNESDIRVSFENTGSWSYIGVDALRVSKSEATMNFGWLNDLTPEREFKRVVLHEFGHALGLIHEHQSPAVNINWNRDYIYNSLYFTLKWDKNTVDKNFFQEYEKATTQYSQVDPLSIMAYSFPANFTYDGTSFPLNYELSDIDKEYIGKVYP